MQIKTSAVLPIVQKFKKEKARAITEVRVQRLADFFLVSSFASL